MTTVCEDLVDVLDEIEAYLDWLSNLPHPPKGIYERRAVLANARRPRPRPRRAGGVP